MELARLIEALSRPTAYAAAVDAVEVHQTHISAVFVTGSLAYKIKKPVSLGFVDYSTIKRRKFFCEEEVRLNCRLAPEVYLGVVPVTREGGSVRMEGSGEVLEWAVKMRRLPESATLRAWLSRRGISGNCLEQLARRLAQFYASAASGPEVAATCTLEAIAANARENLDQSAGQVGVALSRPTLERLRERTAVKLRDLHRLIELRFTRGVPRDGHGDLRLDHVYWFPDHKAPGDWAVVDCIEFDTRYRYADPIADVAFLAMELELAGRADLASAFVDAYLRAAGDETGAGLLAFYRAYRAAVRGKVEGMKFAEIEIPERERFAARDRARALWLYALSELEEPARRPCLVLLAGLPGTGKSTLARGLSDEAGFSVIRSDVVRRELAGRIGIASAPSAFGENLYSSEHDERTYAECLRRAEATIFQAGRVLVDASFRGEARRRLFLEAVRRWGIAARVLVCSADPAVVRRRLEERRDDASDADWRIYEEAARRWEPLGTETLGVTRAIDCNGSRSDALEQALRVLRESGIAR
jgi:aminoglycoside phosphotransferase family enzyme/predicted kinase